MTPRPTGPRHLLLEAARARSLDRLVLLTRIAAAHPDGTRFRFFGEDVHLVTDPALCREVLVTHGRAFAKGRGLEHAKQVLGEGLLTSEGPEHLRARRLAQPAFHRQRMEQYAEEMVAAAARRRSGYVDRQPVDVVDEMAALTLDVVGRTLFGAQLEADEVTIRAALVDFLRSFDRMLSPLGNLLPERVFPVARRVEAARARLDEVVRRIIAEHRARPDVDDDVLSLLMAARDEETGGSQFTDDQLRDEVVTLVLAGHETTANALAWTWWHLQQEPAARAALRRELDAVVGDGLPAYSDLLRLPVTTATLAESMRLHPPAWVIGRRALVDVPLGPDVVPARALVMVSPWLTQRDPRWWGPDALEFRPERWLRDGAFDEAAPGQPRGAWFPFGAGTRVCIGESFAWTEGVLLLATLAATCELRYDDPVAVRPRAAITVRPTRSAGHVLTRAGLPKAAQQV